MRKDVGVNEYRSERNDSRCTRRNTMIFSGCFWCEGCDTWSVLVKSGVRSIAVSATTRGGRGGIQYCFRRDRCVPPRPLRYLFPVNSLFKL